MVGGFVRQLIELADRTGAEDVHEVGCGEGELAQRLAARGLRVRGTDASPEVIAEARRRAEAAGMEVAFRAAPVEELDPATDAAELVVCCEVLEHLHDPHAGLEVVARLANPWAIVSVPREPLWRVLGGVRNRIASGVSIGIQASLADLAAAVERELAAGYQRIKIKVKPGWDLDAVRTIRERFGSIPLMVDANAAYGAGDADHLARLEITEAAELARHADPGLQRDDER